MSEWTRSPWSSAQQVQATIDEDLPPIDEGLSPADHCRALAAAGEEVAAVNFIAHALPRYECVVWATRVALECGALDRTAPLGSAILRWIDDPGEAGRRRVRELSEAVRDSRVDYLIGAAIFYSGGSIAPVEMAPVLPKADVTAKLAGAAVITAALDGDRNRILARAIELGEAIASGGLDR